MVFKAWFWTMYVAQASCPATMNGRTWREWHLARPWC